MLRSCWSAAGSTGTSFDSFDPTVSGPLDGGSFQGSISYLSSTRSMGQVFRIQSTGTYNKSSRVTEAVVAAARASGVLVYSGTGNANGTDGDQLLLGPPFVVTDEELARIVDVVTEAVSAGIASTAA